MLVVPLSANDYYLHAQTLAEQKIASMEARKEVRKSIIQLEWELKVRSKQIEDLDDKARSIKMFRLSEEQQQQMTVMWIRKCPNTKFFFYSKLIWESKYDLLCVIQTENAQRLFKMIIKYRHLGSDVNLFCVSGQTSGGDIKAGISDLAASDVLQAANCYHPPAQMDDLLLKTHTLSTPAPHPVFFFLFSSALKSFSIGEDCFGRLFCL